MPALVVSSMLPDLEKDLILLMTGGIHGRLILHSLLGAITLGTILSVFITIFLYPTVVSLVFRVDKEKVLTKCTFSARFTMTCLVGCAFHVLIDSLHHKFNPLLYPFLNEFFDVFLLLSDWVSSTIVMHFIFLASFVFIMILEIRNGIRGFWDRMFVG